MASFFKFMSSFRAAAGMQGGSSSEDVSLPPIISEPRSGVAIPEGSVVPPAIFAETPGAKTGYAPITVSEDVPEPGLRVNVPSQAPSTPSRGMPSDSASTPSRLYHVETPGKSKLIYHHISGVPSFSLPISRVFVRVSDPGKQNYDESFPWHESFRQLCGPLCAPSDLMSRRWTPFSMHAVSRTSAPQG